MSSCNLTTQINSKQCLSESRKVINDNFFNLDTALCTVSAFFSGTLSNKVSRVIPGNGITLQPASSNGTGTFTIDLNTCPKWQTGVTGKMLYDEIPGNNISTQYAEFNNLLKHVSDTTERNIPLPGCESLITLPYDFGNQTDKFCGSMLLPDDRIFLGPNLLTDALIYDIKTGTAYKPPIPAGIGYPNVIEAFSGTILLPDGRVFFVPYNTIYARVYTPGTHTLSTELSAGNYLTPKGFSKGVLLPNGSIYHVPYNSLIDRTYNIKTGANTTSPNIYPGVINSFSDGVLLPNGQVFLVPYGHTSAALYNFNTKVLSYILTYSFPNGGGFSGGVMLDDGRIFCVPSNNSKAAIYDPSTNTFTIPSGVYPIGGTSCGGCLLTDGRVLITPVNGNTIKIYDPREDALHDTGLKLGSGISHSNGMVLKNGDVFFAPRDNKNAKYLKYFHQSSFSMNFLTGLFV